MSLGIFLCAKKKVDLLILIFVFGVFANYWISVIDLPSLNNPLTSTTQAIDSNNNFQSILGEIKDQNVNENETWSGNILVTRTIVVSKSATLTILPGTIVKFQHYRGYKDPNKKLSLFIEGTIHAHGEADNQIWFTSDAAPPINGDWDGIYINGSKDSFFNYTIVEYGIVGIVQYHCESIVANSIVRWVNSEGLYAEYSKVKYINNTLYGNGYHEIALEQFNNATVYRNIFKNGIVAFHSENSESYLLNNYFTNYSGDVVSIAAHSNATIKENIFDDTLDANHITVTSNSNATLINNDNGTITLPLPIFDYEDIQNFTLNYIPGDKNDQFLYVYDSIDETRQVKRRMGENLSFGWALEYAMGYLWRFDFWNLPLGSSLDLIRMDPDNGSVIRIRNDYIENPRGLAFDGDNFFVYDHSQLKISQFMIANNSIVILNTFDIPKKVEGGTQSLTSDGYFLYLPSRMGDLIRKINKSGSLIEEIPVPGDGIAGGLTWTGTHFWGVSGGRNLTKYTSDWQLIGQCYPVADGTWAIAYDGDYIWTLQRTCESWIDNKMFQVEPLISTQTKYNITLNDTLFTFIVKSNSSDFGLHYNAIEREIIYEIYGRQGSMGFSTLFLPKGFLPGDFSVVAQIDDIEIPVEITQTDLHIILDLEYAHNYFRVIRIKIDDITDSSTTTIPSSSSTQTSFVPLGFIFAPIGLLSVTRRIIKKLVATNRRRAT